MLDVSWVLDGNVAYAAVMMAQTTILKMSKVAPGSQPGAVVVIKLPGGDATPYFATIEEFSDAARKRRCQDIALAKLATTARTGFWSEQVPPAMMCANDTVYAGSVIWMGIELAISGYKGWCDESAAMIIAVAIHFLCNTIVERVKATESGFVGARLNDVRADVLREVIGS